MKQKIYLVTDGSYSDYHVIGAFSTKEKAEYGQRLYKADNIEEYDLDDLPDHPKDCLGFTVRMLKNGDVLYVGQERAERMSDPEWEPYGDSYGSDPCSVEFRMWAKDEKHAIKIANERRIRLIESNEWTTDWKEWRKKRI